MTKKYIEVLRELQKNKEKYLNILEPHEPLVEGGDIFLVGNYHKGQYELNIFDRVEGKNIITKRTNNFILDSSTIKKEIVEELLDIRERIYDDKKEVKKYINKAYSEIRMRYELFCEDIKQENIVGPAFTVMKLDNYMDNVESFYNKQPFFYDKSNIFWMWNDILKKYEIIDDVDIMNLLDSILGFEGQTVNSKTKSNYLEAFKRVGRKNIPKDAPKKWVQFRDKAISLKSGKIYDVTSDYFFCNPIPHNIGETSETPTMDKLFEEWVGEDYVKTLYEIIAYICYTDYPIQTIICLYGSGRNGKSQFLKILNRFVGSFNICSTELDTLIDSRFECFKLYKKLLCCLGETNFGVLRKTSLIKKLVGGDLIGYEKKGKDPFDAVNYAKVIIASNSLPTSEDTSDGFMRRWLIVNFPNEFKEGKDIITTIPEQEYNNLAKKVTEILPKLLENGELTNQGTIKERRENYMLASNPLPIFIRQCCEKGEDRFISYSKLYTAYVKFLMANKKRKVKMGEFKSALEMEGFWMERTSKMINDVHVSGNYIDGIGLKPDYVNYVLYVPNLTLKPYRESGVKTLTQSAQFTQNSTSFISKPQNPVKTGEIEGSGRFILIENYHQKCYICGESPSQWEDSLKRGKPICGICKISLEGNE